MKAFMKLSKFHIFILVLVVGTAGILVSLPKKHVKNNSSTVQTDWTGGQGTNIAANEYNEVNNLDTATSGKLSLGSTSISDWCNVPSCDSNWTRRQQVYFQNVDGEITGQQELVFVKYIDGMKSDFSDLRFTDSNGTILPHYLLDKTDSSEARVWVKLGTVNTTSRYLVYMYFGNSSASSSSDQDATMLFTDKFESGNLDNWPGRFGTPVINGDEVILNSNEPNQGTGLTTYRTFDPSTVGKVLQWDSKWVNKSCSDPFSWSVGMQVDSGYYETNNQYLGGLDCNNFLNAGTLQLSTNTQGAAINRYAIGTYYTFRIINRDGGKHQFLYSTDQGRTFNPITNYDETTSSDSGLFNLYFYAWNGNNNGTMHVKNISVSDMQGEMPKFFGAVEHVGGKTGDLTSSVIDVGDSTLIGTLDYQLINSGDSFMQVRTSNDPNMVTNTPEWYTCKPLASGLVISNGNACANLRDRYVQYKITISADSGEDFYLQSVQLNYIQDSIAPSLPTNLSIKSTSSGTAISAGSWSRFNTPYFSWNAAQDNQIGDSSGLAGYCLYLGEDNSADPVTTSGILKNYTYGTDYRGDDVQGSCQYATNSTHLDTSVLSTMMSATLPSNATYYLIVKSIDNIGNVSNSNVSTSIKIDTNSPSAGTQVNVPSVSGTKTFNVSWGSSFPAFATDDASGLAGFKYCLQPLYLGVDSCNQNDLNWYGLAHSSGDIHDTSDVIPFGNGGFQTVAADAARLDDEIAGINFVMIVAVDNAGNVLEVSSSNVILLFKNAAAPPANLNVAPSTNTINSFAFTWDVPSFFLGGPSDVDYCWSVNDPITVNGSNCNWTGKGIRQLAAGAYATQQGLNTMYVASKDISGNFNGTQSATIPFYATTTAPGSPRDLDSSDVSIRATSTWKIALSWNPPTLPGSGTSSYKIYRSTDNTNFTQVGTSSASNTSFIDSGLAQQLYYYNVRACDNANNCSAPGGTVSRTPTGRFTEPATILSSDSPNTRDVSTRKATVYWLTDRESDSKVAYGTKSGQYSTEEVGNATQTADHSVNLSNLQPNTTYYYVAKWTDPDGNLGTSSEKTFKTAPAPTISEVATNKVSISSATLSFRSKDNSKVKILFGQNGALGGQKEINTSLRDSAYTVILDGLNDGTKYSFQMNGVDIDGNEYPGDIYSFTTLARPKISNLRFQPIDGEPSSTTKVTWTTNVAANSGLSYGVIDAKRIEVLDNTLTLEHSVTIRDLIDASKYTLTASSTDAGGVQAVSDLQTFDTKLDTRAPKISNVSIESSVKGTGADSKGQVIVSWKTDEKATSQIAYSTGQSGELNNTNSEDARLTTEHTVVLSDFATSTIYRLTPVSRDAANNKSKQSVQTVIIGRGSSNIFGIVLDSLQKIFGIKAN